MLMAAEEVKVTITAEELQAVLTAVQDMEVLLLVVAGLLAVILGVMCAQIFWRRMH